MLHTMSTPRAARRTAEEVNEEIRALWRHARGRLDAEQRRDYQRLVTEWAAASEAQATNEAHAAPEAQAVSRRGPVRAA